jgi:2OG-Fe(II) oxygenase superfamily
VVFAYVHLRPTGIHQTLKGGYLKIHTDDNTRSDKGLLRRVNLFLFLNSDWKDSYGGHLELWSRDLALCQQYILPVANRLVVFSTTDYTYHGHQSPLQCPPDRSRRSLALYYYSATRPDEECRNSNCSTVEPKTVMYNTSCAHCDDPQCRAYL